MGKTYKLVPFDLETAKKIQAGEIEGRIGCDLGTIRIIEFDLSPIPDTIEGTIFGTFIYGEKELLMFDNNGICTNRSAKYNLFIELLEEEPKHEFKVGNKVRVNLPKDVVTKYLILGNYQGKVATIINVEGSYVKVKADGLQPYSFDVDYLIPYEEKHEFKPFDKVLCRDDDDDVWKANLFSHEAHALSYPYYVCGGNFYKECIPYEGNEDLVGTTDKPE